MPENGDPPPSAALNLTEPTFDEEALRAGETLFERAWRFKKGVVAMDGLPDANRAEIAFAGRSNVGKSSLINAVMRQNGLARTSNTPGRTQELNFFETDAPLYVVDLPGYGFAKAPKDKVDAWTDLIKTYLKGRPSLVRVFVLIDARHGVKDVDRAILTMLDEAAVTYQVVLTKVDKIKAAGLTKLIAATQDALKRHPAAFPHVLATSSQKAQGISALRATIAQLL